MNGNPRVPASPGGRSDAPTVIGAGCAQILLPGKGKRPTIALIMPSLWGMSVKIEVRRKFRGKVQMVSLGGVKQTLRDNSPWLYEKVHRFYQKTPYVKHRNARLARIQDDLSKKVRARYHYELRIVGEYLND